MMLMRAPAIPTRVQRSRAHGWKKPSGCIYVGRPTVFGNPFPVAVFGAERAVELFARWADGKMSPEEMRAHEKALGPPYVSLKAARAWLIARLPDLRGQDLCCWCPLSSPCHVDALLELANR